MVVVMVDVADSGDARMEESAPIEESTGTNLEQPETKRAAPESATETTAQETTVVMVDVADPGDARMEESASIEESTGANLEQPERKRAAPECATKTTTSAQETTTSAHETATSAQAATSAQETTTSAQQTTTSAHETQPPKKRRTCRDVTEFTKVNKIGVGTYGEVCMAIDKSSHEYVALKRVLMDNEKEGVWIFILSQKDDDLNCSFLSLQFEKLTFSRV